MKHLTLVIIFLLLSACITNIKDSSKVKSIDLIDGKSYKYRVTLDDENETKIYTNRECNLGETFWNCWEVSK
jgi:hypothetical protein